MLRCMGLSCLTFPHPKSPVYFAFAELPSAQMILGAGIVIAAGVFVILREARLGLRRGQARRAKPPPAL